MPHYHLSLLNFLLFFFFNDTATTQIYTLSLHDALPIYTLDAESRGRGSVHHRLGPRQAYGWRTGGSTDPRSEEHTSELQSHVNLVCRLLLEKKKKKKKKKRKK